MNSEVPLGKIRCGQLITEDIEKLQDAGEQFFNSDFYFLNEPNACFNDLKNTILWLAEEKHIQILFVDGFEYIKEAVEADEETCRTRQMHLLNGFKYLAKTLHIPIVITVDLPDANKNEEPSLKDFKKTMIIPEEADKVHKERLPEVHWLEEYPQAAKLILAKSKNGCTGCFELKFDRNICKFTDDSEV